MQPPVEGVAEYETDWMVLVLPVVSHIPLAGTELEVEEGVVHVVSTNSLSSGIEQPTTPTVSHLHVPQARVSSKLEATTYLVNAPFGHVTSPLCLMQTFADDAVGTHTSPV
jgi:hypothetical protein